MMKPFLRALLCLCLLLPLAAKANKPFTDVFVFGDSLSDTGNLAAFRDVNLPLLPPFFPGPQPVGTFGLCNPVDIFLLGRRCDDLLFRENRVSNGPVAVETLAKRLGIDALEPSLYFLPLNGIQRPQKCTVDPVTPCTGTNYAVASAHAAPLDPGDVLASLPTQIGAFLVDHGSSAPPDALYVVMIGGNDVIDASKAAIALLQGADLEPEETPQAIIDAAVDAIADNISLLIARGAQNVLVANSANVGSVPATRIRADEEGLPPALVIKTATRLTIRFNRQLARRVNQLRADLNIDSVKMEMFNFFIYFEGVRLVARLFGLNTVDACFDTEAYQDFSMLMAVRNFHPDCAPDAPGAKPEFDNFIFLDDLHPTGRVHDVIGQAMARAAHRLSKD
jgi:phospholipase/lecithinase/hemolysin